MRHRKSTVSLLWISALVLSCADRDNPTALADLDPVTEFEIAAHVHTMLPVAVVANVRESGALMQLRNARLEVSSPSGYERTVPLLASDHGYEAQVRFYEPGEHRMHLYAQPEKNHLARELGEHEIHAVRQHLVVEDHRFEIAINPAPILAGALSRVTLYAWELEHDGSRGHEAEGVELHATLHMPSGLEANLSFEEVDHGQYEAMTLFPQAGSYGLEVGIEVDEHGDDGNGDHGHDDEGGDGGDHGSEFEIYVPSLTGEVVDEGGGDDGGHTH